MSRSETYLERQPSQDVLVHFGIKGMKWGHRKSTVVKAAPSTASADAIAAAEAKKKVKANGTKSLTNQEMQQLVTRMNLEQQYSNLKKQSGGMARFKDGMSTVTTILSTVDAANKAANVVNGPAAKLVKAELEKQKFNTSNPKLF